MYQQTPVRLIGQYSHSEQDKQGNHQFYREETQNTDITNDISVSKQKTFFHFTRWGHCTTAPVCPVYPMLPAVDDFSEAHLLSLCRIHLDQSHKANQLPPFLLQKPSQTLLHTP